MKNLLRSLLSITFALSLPLTTLAAINTVNDKISYAVSPNSITFYLDKINLDTRGEYIVSCFNQGSGLASSTASARGTDPEITLSGLKQDTIYTCSVKTITFIENGGINESKVIGFASDPIQITTGEKLRILDWSQGIDWVQVRVSAVDLAPEEVYFLECKVDAYEEIAPHAKSKEPIFKIENLDWLSKYTCEAGIGKDNQSLYLTDITQISENTIQVVTSGKEQIVPDRGIQFNDGTIKNWESYTRPFPDVYFDGIWGKAAAELYRRGIASGYPDGEFKGAQSVNRAEASKLLLLARFKNIPDYDNTYQFKDVWSGKWYTKYIMMAAQKNIIHGYEDGLFRPDNPVNTAEFIKMISRTFNLPQNLPYHYKDVPKDHWYAQYAGIIEKMNIFPDRKENLFPDQKLSRYEVAVAIYQTILYLENTTAAN